MKQGLVTFSQEAGGSSNGDYQQVDGVASLTPATAVDGGPVFHAAMQTTTEGAESKLEPKPNGAAAVAKAAEHESRSAGPRQAQTKRSNKADAKAATQPAALVTPTQRELQEIAVNRDGFWHLKEEIPSPVRIEHNSEQAKQAQTEGVDGNKPNEPAAKFTETIRDLLPGAPKRFKDPLIAERQPEKCPAHRKTVSLSRDRYDREELYEKVWAVPIQKLAKEYGVSDVALARACKRRRVPVPGRGYWAKKAAGKSVPNRPPLGGDPPFPLVSAVESPQDGGSSDDAGRPLPPDTAIVSAPNPVDGSKTVELCARLQSAPSLKRR